MAVSGSLVPAQVQRVLSTDAGRGSLIVAVSIVFHVLDFVGFYVSKAFFSSRIRNQKELAKTCKAGSGRMLPGCTRVGWDDATGDEPWGQGGAHVGMRLGATTTSTRSDHHFHETGHTMQYGYMDGCMGWSSKSHIHRSLCPYCPAARFAGAIHNMLQIPLGLYIVVSHFRFGGHRLDYVTPESGLLLLISGGFFLYDCGESLQSSGLAQQRQRAYVRRPAGWGLPMLGNKCPAPLCSDTAILTSAQPVPYSTTVC